MWVAGGLWWTLVDLGEPWWIFRRSSLPLPFPRSLPLHPRSTPFLTFQNPLQPFPFLELLLPFPIRDPLLFPSPRSGLGNFFPAVASLPPLPVCRFPHHWPPPLYYPTVLSSLLETISYRLPTQRPPLPYSIGTWWGVPGVERGLACGSRATSCPDLS